MPEPTDFDHLPTCPNRVPMTSPLVSCDCGIVTLERKPLMPETPDFDQIARRVADVTGVGRLEEWDAADPDRVVKAIAEQLRQVWNARGAADIAQIETISPFPTKVSPGARRKLDR